MTNPLERISLSRLLLLVAIGFAAACHHDGTVLSSDGGVDDAGVVVPSTDGGCTAAGNSCVNGSDCCSGSCEGNLCTAAQCASAGSACAFATDCCNLNCANGTCSASACISDNQPCGSGGSCCSTECVSGACKPLSTTCKTAGNACPNGNGDCCSGLCTSGVCAAPSQVSYCTQPNDICFHDNECCTGICSGATTTTAGTCATISSGCSVDGLVCNGCTGCCSSFCAPFGTMSSKICQPASGCHVTGDLCHTDSDCCGGDPTQIGTIPGAGIIRCVPDPMHPGIGTCSTPDPNNCPMGQSCGSACVPEGDVCHYKNNGGCSSNSIRNDCCGATGNKGMCQLDKLGVPRCYGLKACVMPAGDCASAADCCNEAPCIPDTTGHLKCSAMSCTPQGGVCTTTADCCTGLPCLVPPGGLQGTCAQMTPGPGPSDGGVALDMAGTPACALFGQSCSTTVSCCAQNGTCLSPSYTACVAGEADCTCTASIL